MSYSEFSLPESARRFSLTIDESQDLFTPVQERTPSDLLTTVLAENTPLALAMQTEKARSELLIVPILLEVRRAMSGQVSLFSGADFNVDPSVGLNGVCDFLLSRSPHQVFIQSPVLAVVEAKREDIVSGMGQCVAEMVAAQRFNERDGSPIETVYGAVTTGDIWKFLKLEGSTAFIDLPTYYLNRVEAILGVLLRMVSGCSKMC
jgi:hypothetical protein